LISSQFRRWGAVELTGVKTLNNILFSDFDRSQCSSKYLKIMYFLFHSCSSLAFSMHRSLLNILLHCSTPIRDIVLILTYDTPNELNCLTLKKF
jgi:hypothetical protein